MKYLKNFNEAITEIDELQQFCEEHLTYLLDNNEFEFEVRDDIYGKKWSKIKYIIHLRKPKTGFYWNEVKDNFIPFLFLLNDKFNINRNEVNFLISTKFNDSKYFLIDDVLNDKFNISDRILSISISII